MRFFCRFINVLEGEIANLTK